VNNDRPRTNPVHLRQISRKPGERLSSNRRAAADFDDVHKES
jgi:hypothetical protein